MSHSVGNEMVNVRTVGHKGALTFQNSSGDGKRNIDQGKYQNQDYRAKIGKTVATVKELKRKYSQGKTYKRRACVSHKKLGFWRVVGKKAYASSTENKANERLKRVAAPNE